MKAIVAIIKKELIHYFYSAVAYVFIAIFLFATIGSTFYIGSFFQANQASLEAFFVFHPWLYLFLIPAIGMRLWSEEKNSGTLEILFTLPITVWQAIIGKYLAGLIFIGTALILTFPLVITVFYLGEPDVGIIVASYLGSFLMAGCYLAVTCCTSALTNNQVISFVTSCSINFFLVLLGWGVFAESLSSILGGSLADIVSTFSYSTHFENFLRGVVDTRDIIYFVSFAIFLLWLNAAILEHSQR